MAALFVLMKEREKKKDLFACGRPHSAAGVPIYRILTLSIYGQQQVNGSVTHSIDMHIGAVCTTRNNPPKKRSDFLSIVFGECVESPTGYSTIQPPAEPYVTERITQ